MTTALIAGILLIAGVLFFKSRVVPSFSVTATDIPAIINQLRLTGTDESFADIGFLPPGSADRGADVHIQYSIDKGLLGFDWVLIVPRNIADEEKVIAFAATLGHRLEKQEMNNVRYLRMTGDHLAELGTKIILDLYQIPPDAKLDMTAQGFAWGSSKAPSPGAAGKPPESYDV
ncbi:MAG TPA: hypothetical protein VG733_03115 [Chthoniobacteraceae bacterium]|nr:hypothetical protein [Chthoniobacteraceae bacterium]